MDQLFTPFYTAILGGGLLTVQSLLMLNVGMYRTGLKKGVGIDGDIILERLVRRHGNLAENAAIFVAVLAIYEVLFGQTGLAFWIAVAFAVARLMHGVGFSSAAGSHLIGAEGGKKIFLMLRAGGAMLTAATSVVLGVALVIGVANAF